MTYWKVVEEPSVEKLENRGSVYFFNAKKKKHGRKHAGGCSEKHGGGGGRGGGTECTAMKVAKLYPLVLLVKVSAGKVKCWEVKKAGCWEMDCLSMEWRKIIRAFRLGFEFCWILYLEGSLWQNFDTSGRAAFGRKVTVGRDPRDACSTIWMLVTKTEFVPGPRKIKANLDRFGNCRTFRIFCEIQPAARRSNTQTLATVRPTCAADLVQKKKKYRYDLHRSSCLLLWMNNKLFDWQKRANDH